jgi:hypothetical protein
MTRTGYRAKPQPLGAERGAECARTLSAASVIDKRTLVHYSAYMPVFEFTQHNMPTGEELRRMLQQAEENYDPLAELLRMERELSRLEDEHGMTSEEFANRYQSGELGDDFHFIIWSGKYRLYLRLREMISNSLAMVIAADISSIT